VDLQTEYYLRNSVRTPLIRHTNGILLLCNPSKTSTDRWEMLNIKFSNKEGEDGAWIDSFDVIRATAYHNNHSSRNFFSTIFETKVYWDEFEGYVHKLAEKLKDSGCHAITSPSQKQLACWEILCYTHDSVFAEQPVAVLDLNYKVINDNLRVEERLEAIDDLVNFLNVRSESGKNSSNCKSILQAWSHLRSMFDNTVYAHWLAQLINR